MKWEDDKIELLKACVEAGWIYKDIANELDRTQSGISAKSIKLKLISQYKEKLTNEIVDERLENRTINRFGNYINARTKINFNCLICNNTWKALPDNILTKNIGCPNCSDTTLTNKIVDERLKTRKIKRIDNYINSYTKISFQCLNITCNNTWFVAPYHVFRGIGCPKCATHGFKYNKPAATYCIYFKDLEIYKIGITNNFKRRCTEFGYKPEIIFIREFELGKDAKILETQWLENIKEYKVNTNKLLTGNTETFRYAD